MNELDTLQSVLDKTIPITRGVKPDQLTLPTPCTDFNVQQLLDHFDEWIARYVEQATGQPLPQGTDFAAATKQLMAGLRDKVSDRPPSVGMMIIEYISHGWDLATATGQPVPYTDEEAAVGLAFGQANLTDAFRGPDKPFGPKLTPPADASAVEQLIAFMGRRPR